jgi:hypothetical protein
VDPIVVLNTIREVPFAKSFMQIFSSIIPVSVREEFRNAIGTDPKKLNNYQSSEALKQINQKLEAFGGHSIYDLMEKAISLFPNTNDFGLHNRIGGVFALLDLVGYWKDDLTDTSDYARLWDSYHAFFASKCKYFVSNDKRTRNKTKVTYEMFNIDTIVVGIDPKTN